MYALRLNINAVSAINACQDGFRVVYGTRLGKKGSLIPKSYFRDDLEDCSTNNNSATCQEVWGINTGEFVDISLNFGSTAGSYTVYDRDKEIYSIAPLATTFSLTDKGNRVTDFNASIVRIPGFKETYKFTQETNQFCVFEGDFVVGCEDRAPHSRPIIHECGSGSLHCTTSYFTPKFIASYKAPYRNPSNPTTILYDETSAVLEPESVYNNTTTLNSVANLAGDDFESFVTDDTFAVKPFSGNNSPNPASLFGVYQDNILPIVGETVNPNAVYISGFRVYQW